MSDDQPTDPRSPNKNTLDYVPRAEVVEEEAVYGQAVDEVVSGGRRSSGSSMAPWLIGGGIGCLLIVVMCAGVIGFGVYTAQQFAGQMFVTDANQVRERTAELAEMAIPDTFQPALGVQLPEVITDAAEGEEPFRWVIYTRNDGRGYLAIGYVAGVMDDPDQQTTGLDGFLAQCGETHRSIEITDEDIREMTIRGEDAEFTFSRGTVEGSDEDFRQVIGHFEGKRQRTWLILQVEAEAYDETEIVAIIASIQ
jgi:RNase P/RNase MRP subunit p29